ncbi:MAG: glycoside hydrolase family 2 TIM barrel-domain containing protein [Puia sp.]|nr:glycoside hydrolase family 2 TIM barrel-domain containing protein [Puia sp.]
MKSLLPSFLFATTCFNAFSQAAVERTAERTVEQTVERRIEHRVEQTVEQTTVIKYLSGTDKDHTVLWDFFCTAGRNSGKWTTIPVPSCWEQQGFGNYNYGHDKVKFSEQGLYKYKFRTEPGWEGKKVFLVFEGSMTDTKVTINGRTAGPVHQGSFYRFKYDITSLINGDTNGGRRMGTKGRPTKNVKESSAKDANEKDTGGDNLLEVTVSKMSANASVNNAERGNSDFWLFGGIYRPVYLEIVPRTFIERTAIDARADGSFRMEVYAKNIKGDETFVAQVKTLKGEDVGKPFSVRATAAEKKEVPDRTNAAIQNDGAAGKDDRAEEWELTSQFPKPLRWSSEFPNLYQVVLSVKNEGGVLHQVRQRFGFRTVELRRGDGFYVNGEKILFKGSDRHSFWPETGRTLSHAVHLMDVKLMKEMNMNAVRMSHYPPDADFLDVCDSLGLYVLDELTGWQAAYDTVVGHRLVKEMVTRDVNHPAVVIWDNGNEGGWNRGIDDDYAWYDPQGRIVIHPFERFNGTHTKHYPNYGYVLKSVAEEKDVFFPTEFMHGLYDGGAGAALDDYWNLLLTHPHGAGGFIWAFLDEAVIRTDKDSAYDSDGNHAPDGIVGPHREKEASFYTIKEIWSPVAVDPPVLDGHFNGRLTIRNRYFFTNLNQCAFTWSLVSFPPPGDKTTAPILKAGGKPAPVDMAPGQSGILALSLPPDWQKSDALYLTAYGPDKRELFTWSWPLKTPAVIRKSEPLWTVKQARAQTAALRAAARKSVPQPATRTGMLPSAHDEGALLTVTCKGLKYVFDKTTGTLQKVIKPNTEVSLSHGPLLAGVATTLTRFHDSTDRDNLFVQADYREAANPGTDTTRNPRSRSDMSRNDISGIDTSGTGGYGTATLHIQWTFSATEPVKLEYSYTQRGVVDFSGIGFDYPEEKITGMKWLGRGPYRVWKNRLKGQRWGVWHKQYNNAVTGEDWIYPEFKGYHAEMNWVVVENRESPFTVYTDNKDLYLQMLHPQRAKDSPANNHVEPPFPTGGIGFLNTIPPIGDKFIAADRLGPQSQKNQLNGEPVNGTLWFDFGR